MNVYVIAASDHGPSKIGIAVDPEKRLKGLQTGSHRPLRLYHVEPIGAAASAIEHAVHQALSGKRSEAGTEWFDVPPVEARAVILAAAAAADVLIDDKKTLDELEMRSALRWLTECEREAAAREERGDYDYDDVYGAEPPTVLELLAGTIRPPKEGRHTFNDYLLSWEEGMWLRHAFDRMGKRMPSGRRLEPYLEAARHIEYEGDIVSRWIEWSMSRDLRSYEPRALAAIWDEFAPRHNLIERKGPQWATAGIDDQVDDVHLFVLSGNEELGDRDRVVFYHDSFRAVLVPDRRLNLYERGDLGLLKNVGVSGFVAPAMPSDIWQRPLKPWLREATARRDAALMRFVDNPAKRYPAQRPYDGPQPATEIWVGLSRFGGRGIC